MADSTEALCAPLGGLLVSFPVGCRKLGISLRTGENWLRSRDPRLPPVLRTGKRRFFAIQDISAKRDPISDWDQKPKQGHVDHHHLGG